VAKAQDIARALEEIGVLLALSGESRFKRQAYERGAAIVAALSDTLAGLISEGRLTEVEGIGAGLAGQIVELWQTGSSPVLERLRAAHPPGAAQLARLPGLTRKRIQALYEGLGISSLESLREACTAQRVRGLKGFGPKTEQRLLDALAAPEPEPLQGPIVLAEGLRLAARLARLLRLAEPSASVEIAGACRRREEMLDQLDFAIVGGSEQRVLDALERLPGVAALERATRRAQLAEGVPLQLHFVSAEEKGLGLIHATGPDAHVRALHERAAARASYLAAAEQEADVYARVGLSYVPPELRDDGSELDEAARTSFEDLLTDADLRGAVHCHTNYSDGKHSIEQMARAAELQGLAYITITDHSPTADYARGVTLDRLKQQWDEISDVQTRVSIRILRGTESDILADGALDYPDAILEQLDVVIASIHARLRMDRAEMTARLCRAMQLPVFKIWGHALGRLLLTREPIDCDVEAVLDALAGAQGAIEINGDPHRLDLPPAWVKHARARHIPFVISADAHSTAGLASTRFGVMMARRGGLRRSEVLNTLPAAEFVRRVRPAQGNA
jgi:DNA polymerase (family 10)